MDLSVLTREHKGVMATCLASVPLSKSCQTAELARVPGLGETGLMIFTVSRPDVDFGRYRIKVVSADKKSGSRGWAIRWWQARLHSCDVGGDRLIRAVGREQSRDFGLPSK